MVEVVGFVVVDAPQAMDLHRQTQLGTFRLLTRLQNQHNISHISLKLFVIIVKERDALRASVHHLELTMATWYVTDLFPTLLLLKTLLLHKIG